MNMVVLIVAAFFSILAPPARADHPAIHGMVLFGGANAVYASHLPLFHPPHDYQVILELAMRDDGQSGAVAEFEKLRRLPGALFTFAPENMDLTKVISGVRKSFAARLYKGHFERDGQEIGSVVLDVVKVIYSAKLKSSDGPSNDYLVFGRDGEYFAIHLIGGAPSFDAVLEVGRPFDHNSALPDSALPLRISSEERGRPPAQRLGNQTGPWADIKSSVYFEREELAH